MRKKLMLQKLSNSYLDAVNSFQKASKNYINKTVLNSMSEKHMETSDNVQYDEFTNFLRKSNPHYDSSKDRLNVNIYDYNFYENDDNDGSGNVNRNGHYSGNHSGSNDVDEPHYSDYRNIEKEGLQNSIGNKKKRKKYKSSIFTGNKKNDVSEYLLQNNDFIENEKEEYYEEKQFISIKTVDIENEILNQKNKEIKKLHKDIINIQDIYKELFDQINIQGETIDNIDSQIVNTHDSIILSGREIQITRNRYFRNIRCIGYLFIALFILIIIILVVFKII
ncbi:syntaxin, Qa-SNARE family, putative [Plasmodium ovale curtisi]|nr:syntaxin, Qa-SNARE family, putative [Plasmodium ovale curtisi]